MANTKPIIAMMYDFDKTLCDEDMQNYSFIPNLGMNPTEFWNEISEFSSRENMEGILSYLYMMVKKCKEKGIRLSKSYLRSLGKDVHLYPGVREWFGRINEYGKEQGVKIEHYVISSGIRDIIKGTDIANEFCSVYACDFYYDENGEVVWPKIAINYTLKTQYLFRINKGATDENDDKTINEKTLQKRIPFRNMIYIGDGLTDIPCMTLLKKQGGKSIGLYTNKTRDRVEQFLLDERINYMCRANYNENSELDKIIKLIIQSCALSSKLAMREEAQVKKAEEKRTLDLENI